MFLHCSSAQEPDHLHEARLAEAEGAVLRLQIHARVPVWIKNDDFVSAGEVQPHAAGARRDHEHLETAIGVEIVAELLAVLMWRTPVEAQR